MSGVRKYFVSVGVQLAGNDDIHSYVGELLADVEVVTRSMKDCKVDNFHRKQRKSTRTVCTDHMCEGTVEA